MYIIILTVDFFLNMCIIKQFKWFVFNTDWISSIWIAIETPQTVTDYSGGRGRGERGGRGGGGDSRPHQQQFRDVQGQQPRPQQPPSFASEQPRQFTQPPPAQAPPAQAASAGEDFSVIVHWSNLLRILKNENEFL